MVDRFRLLPSFRTDESAVSDTVRRPRALAAVGVERGRCVMFFDVTNPLDPALRDVVGVGTEPEGLVWVPSSKLLLVANELSGNVTSIVISEP